MIDVPNFLLSMIQSFYFIVSSNVSTKIDIKVFVRKWKQNFRKSKWHPRIENDCACTPALFPYGIVMFQCMRVHQKYPFAEPN